MDNSKMTIYIGNEPIAFAKNAQLHFDNDFESKEEFDITSDALCDGAFPSIAEPAEITFTIEDVEKKSKNILIDSCGKTRFPRKLKKAISKMWIENDGQLGFETKRRTKWDRKACKMVKYKDGYLTIPYKNGYVIQVKFD